MKRIGRNKFSRVGVVISLAFLSNAQGYQQSMVHSFDSPMAESSYKKVLDTSMQTWGYLELLEEQQDASLDRIMVSDAIVGRMMNVRDHVDTLVGDWDAGTLIRTDDIMYLVEIFNRIEQLYHRVMTRTESNSSALSTITRVKKQLSNLLTD